jgi:hypothetical protein
MRMKFCFAAAILWGAAVHLSTVSVVNAQTWNLANDVVAGGTNPAAPIGDGQWSYYSAGALLTGSTTPATSAGDLNPEVPDEATGWYNPGANHIMAVRFEIDANPVDPVGTGDDKTNFLAGGFGGHADTRARWTSLVDGIFRLDYLGYNARNQETANDNEKGRITQFLVEHLDTVGGLISTIDSKALTGGVEDGAANAYTGTAFVTLAAGESIQVGHAGGEWSGYDMTVARVPEPASMLLVSVGISFLTLLIRRRR